MSYYYKIRYGLAIKEVPEDFSFIDKNSEYRKVLDQKIIRFNEIGETVSNRKLLEIVEKETTQETLVLKLKSEVKMEVPTRGCKTLSKELASTEIFRKVLTKSGKLFIGKDWEEIEAEILAPTQLINAPELMKLMTQLLLRNNKKDMEVIRKIKELIIEAGYQEN